MEEFKTEASTASSLLPLLPAAEPANKHMSSKVLLAATEPSQPEGGREPSEPEGRKEVVATKTPSMPPGWPGTGKRQRWVGRPGVGLVGGAAQPESTEETKVANKRRWEHAN